MQNFAHKTQIKKTCVAYYALRCDYVYTNADGAAKWPAKHVAFMITLLFGDIESS